MKATVLILGILLVAFGVAEEQSLQSRQTNWTVGQTVQTGSGPVNGHAAANATGVSEYLGIPYAMPPVGNLRFASPQNYSGNSTINGTSFGFSCPADLAQYTAGNATTIASANLTAFGLLFLENLAQVGDKFSEDCLTLNIWTKPQTGDAKKAVLLWIYGGGFTTGNSDNLGYNGQYLADSEDVVLVTINYRLNIFGFPGNPAGPNNLGLQDQRLATEWVRDNIAGFGGDPSRITLFGQSAGGASVDYYSFAYTSDPIVNGFIPESGVAANPNVPAQSNTTAAGAWFNVSSTLGCGNSSSNATDVLACMRTKNYTSILGAIPTSSSVIGGSSFGPTVDETVVFSNYIARGAAGNFIKRPVLLGNTNYEAGLFQTVAAAAGLHYPAAYWNAFNLLGFTCPAATRANISVANNVPVWRYRYFGDFPNVELTTTPDSGAYHASEIPIIFNTSAPPAGLSAGIPPATDAENMIATYMRGAWAAFAKDPVNGLNSYQGGWPQYNPTGNTLVRLAYNNQTGTNLAMPVLYDAACNASFPVNSTGSGTANSTATSTGSTSTATSSSGGTGTSTSSGGVATATKSGADVETALSFFVMLSALLVAFLI